MGLTIKSASSPSHKCGFRSAFKTDRFCAGKVRHRLSNTKFQGQRGIKSRVLRYCLLERDASSAGARARHRSPTSKRSELDMTERWVVIPEGASADTQASYAQILAVHAALLH